MNDNSPIIVTSYCDQETLDAWFDSIRHQLGTGDSGLVIESTPHAGFFTHWWLTYTGVASDSSDSDEEGD